MAKREFYEKFGQWNEDIARAVKVCCSPAVRGRCWGEVCLCLPLLPLTSSWALLSDPPPLLTKSNLRLTTGLLAVNMQRHYHEEATESHRLLHQPATGDTPLAGCTWLPNSPERSSIFTHDNVQLCYMVIFPWSSNSSFQTPAHPTIMCSQSPIINSLFHYD